LPTLSSTKLYSPVLEYALDARNENLSLESAISRTTSFELIPFTEFRYFGYKIVANKFGLQNYYSFAKPLPLIFLANIKFGKLINIYIYIYT
jgi:hypothetical protein